MNETKKSEGIMMVIARKAVPGYTVIDILFHI